MKKILVRGVNWIGDAVMTLPALRAVRKAYKGCSIELMVKKWVEGVFESDPNIDALVEYRKEFSGVKGKITASKYLRKKGYDLALLFQNAFDAAILAYLAGIPERIGYNRDGRGFLLSRAVPFTAETRQLHHVLYYLNLLKEVGLVPIYRHPWIYITPEEREYARDRISHMRRPIVLLNPGATYGSAKRWPSERFSQLANRVLQELGSSIIIVGAPSEQDVAGEILQGIDKDAVNSGYVMNLAGQTTLRELITLISQVDVMVTNDSGPMHIAYATGTPLVAIFGSTDPDLTGPLSFIHPEKYGYKTDIEFYAQDRVIKKSLNCSPCFRRECPQGDVRCLKEISTDEVMEAVRDVLPGRKAVFFDRDGTLCHDADYLNRMEDLHIFKDVEYIRRLKERGYLLIGVTNQSGIARGIVDRNFTEKINDIFVKEYGFDAFYYCHHHPDDYCACRKPSPGMALKARAEWMIDFNNSIVVGDKSSDMALAQAIGAEGILVRTGKTDRYEGNYKNVRTFDNLKEVVQYICS